MAAVSPLSPLAIRSPRPGDGAVVARLWRELWDIHESWGGYPGAKDDATYVRVQGRIEHEARARHGSVSLGRHLHLLATLDGQVTGQVEGWCDRYGVAQSTASTCEVRSLIVTEQARGAGAGAALLEALGHSAVQWTGGPTVLAAEVLEPNPAHGFYARCGYHPVSWTLRLDLPSPGRPPEPASRFQARAAQPRDALAIAILEAALAERRQRAGDGRFDPPRAVDAAWLGAIASHLQSTAPLPGATLRADAPLELVAVDAWNTVRATATLVVMTLDPPFLPIRRAALTRISIDPALEPTPLVASLVGLAADVSSRWGATTLEVTDLGPPGAALYQATLRAGATPWSRLVTRLW